MSFELYTRKYEHIRTVQYDASGFEYIKRLRAEGVQLPVYRCKL